MARNRLKKRISFLEEQLRASQAANDYYIERANKAVAFGREQQARRLDQEAELAAADADWKD